MKKRLIGLLLLISVFVTGCVSNDVESEIKELIKDIPLPILYDTRTGEVLEFEKYIVSRVLDSKAYDPLTGKDGREYVVKAGYESYFWQNQRCFVLYMPVESNFPKYRLTIDEITKNKDKLYWSKW